MVATAYAFGVHRPLEYVRDAVRVAEIEEAVPVSACYSGGGALGRVGGLPVGLEADRWTVAQPRFDTVGAPVLPGGSDFWQVSSADEGRSGAATVPAGAFGPSGPAEQAGGMISCHACGEPQVVAETTLTDRRWDVDLAVGDACPPFPTPDLPPAECVIPPCE